MSRISAALAAAFGAERVPIFALVRLEFDSGTLRLWTGTRDLSWNSETWQGVGGLLGFDFPSETSDVRATGGTITLSGLDLSMVAIADTENYQGRPITIYLGAFDAAGAVVVDPDAAYRGTADVMEPAEDGQTATIALAIESRIAAFDRANERRWTDEDQRLDYPDDEGFAYVAGIQDKEIQWGPNQAA